MDQRSRSRRVRWGLAPNGGDLVTQPVGEVVPGAVDQLGKHLVAGADTDQSGVGVGALGQAGEADQSRREAQIQRGGTRSTCSLDPVGGVVDVVRDERVDAGVVNGPGVSATLDRQGQCSRSGRLAGQAHDLHTDSREPSVSAGLELGRGWWDVAVVDGEPALDC